jgi:predicted PurR-regulated permease PerM
MLERRRHDLLQQLIVALGIILVLAFIVFRPFLLTFAVSASVALLLAPLQRKLSGALGGRSSLAAALLVLLSTTIILLPVLSSLALLADQAALFFSWLRPYLQPAELQRLWAETLPARFPWLRDWVKDGHSQLMPLVASALSEVAGTLNALLQGVVAGFASAVVELVLFLLMLFFLLRDGGRLRAELREISPFSEAQEVLIFEHLGRTIRGVLRAMVVVPVAQGLLAAVGFWIFGLPSPLLWGVATILAAMVPVLGSPLGWVPAVVWLYLSDASLSRVVGMFVFGLVVVSGIDNVIKPLLLRETAQIHPLLGFLAILGGVLAFGVFGFLIGPVILSLVLSAMRIYRLDVLRAPALAAPGNPPAAA